MSKTPKVVIRSTASNGEMILAIGKYVYEIWLDAALIPGLKKELRYHPMRAIHTLKKKKIVWKRREDLE